FTTDCVSYVLQPDNDSNKTDVIPSPILLPPPVHAPLAFQSNTFHTNSPFLATHFLSPQHYTAAPTIPMTLAPQSVPITISHYHPHPSTSHQQVSYHHHPQQQQQ